MTSTTSIPVATYSIDQIIAALVTTASLGLTAVVGEGRDTVPPKGHTAACVTKHYLSYHGKDRSHEL